MRQALTATSEIHTENQLLELEGIIKCEKPNNRLYHFDASITVPHDNPAPLSPKQLLLRVFAVYKAMFIFNRDLL